MPDQPKKPSPLKRGGQPGNSNATKHGRYAVRATKRASGAQPANDNALRHGFYSRSFTSAENSGLDSDIRGEFYDEINLARVNANRLAELLKDYRTMPLADVISAANGLNNYLERIQSLTRAQRVVFQNLTTIEQALAELKDIPPEED
jgi:hypothetical protein